MTKLEAIIGLCCAIDTLAGGHRTGYRTVEYFIKEYNVDAVENSDDLLDKDIVEGIRARNNVVRLIIYTRTPVGFYVWVGASLDSLIESCVSTVLEDFEHWIADDELPEWLSDKQHVLNCYKTLGGQHPDKLKVLLGLDM